MKKWINRIIFLIALGVFLYSAGSLANIYYLNYKEGKEYNELQEVVQESKEESEEGKTIDFERLKAINEEVVAWIEIPDTDISYPVVQGSDNSYYLNHTFKKQYNYAGAIFVDANASKGFEDQNTFIYGHNVKHGTMFAELANFKDATFFEEHPIIYLYTPEKTYHAEVISMYQTTDGSDTYRSRFASEERYQEYIQYVTQQGIHSRESDTSKNMITLSTCSYEAGGEASDLRYVVHAMLVEA